MGKQMYAFCPKGCLKPLDIIIKDNGIKTQICTQCGWDSEAEEIFDDSIESDNEIPIL